MKLILVLLGVVVAYAAAQCTKTTLVTNENTACQGTTGNVCVSELVCIGASGTTSGTCKLQAIVGDACTSDTDCTNSFYNQFCSSNKCAIKFKNAGASCTVNGECTSNSCVSGSCAALQVGSPCSSGFCGSPTNALFCTAGTNATCAATAASGAACGTINNVFVQCTPGFYCVGSGTSGTCTAPAAENAACASSATLTTSIWANPGCNKANSALQCLSSKCVAASANIAIGQPCGTTDIVNAGKNCNPRESFCLGYVCTAFSSVSCNSAQNCGLSVGVCNCQSDLTKNGTCAADPYSTVGCSSQALRYSDCQATANTQNLINLCGDKQKAYRCCVRNLNLVPGKDLSLAYCSSATVAQVSIVIMAVVVALFF